MIHVLNEAFVPYIMGGGGIGCCGGVIFCTEVFVKLYEKNNSAECVLCSNSSSIEYEITTRACKNNEKYIIKYIMRGNARKNHYFRRTQLWFCQ